MFVIGTLKRKGKHKGRGGLWSNLGGLGQPFQESDIWVKTLSSEAGREGTTQRGTGSNYPRLGSSLYKSSEGEGPPWVGLRTPTRALWTSFYVNPSIQGSHAVWWGKVRTCTHAQGPVWLQLLSGDSFPTHSPRQKPSLLAAALSLQVESSSSHFPWWVSSAWSQQLHTQRRHLGRSRCSSCPPL